MLHVLDFNCNSHVLVLLNMKVLYFIILSVYNIQFTLSCSPDSMRYIGEMVGPYIKELIQLHVDVQRDKPRKCGQGMEPCILESDCCPEYECTMKVGQASGDGILSVCISKTAEYEDEEVPMSPPRRPPQNDYRYNSPPEQNSEEYNDQGSYSEDKSESGFKYDDLKEEDDKSDQKQLELYRKSSEIGDLYSTGSKQNIFDKEMLSGIDAEYKSHVNENTQEITGVENEQTDVFGNVGGHENNGTITGEENDTVSTKLEDYYMERNNQQMHNSTGSVNSVNGDEIPKHESELTSINDTYGNDQNIFNNNIEHKAVPTENYYDINSTDNDFKEQNRTRVARSVNLSDFIKSSKQAVQKRLKSLNEKLDEIPKHERQPTSINDTFGNDQNSFNNKAVPTENYYDIDSIDSDFKEQNRTRVARSVNFLDFIKSSKQAIQKSLKSLSDKFIKHLNKTEMNDNVIEYLKSEKNPLDIKTIDFNNQVSDLFNMKVADADINLKNNSMAEECNVGNSLTLLKNFYISKLNFKKNLKLLRERFTELFPELVSMNKDYTIDLSSGLQIDEQNVEHIEKIEKLYLDKYSNHSITHYNGTEAKAVEETVKSEVERSGTAYVEGEGENTTLLDSDNHNTEKLYLDTFSNHNMNHYNGTDEKGVKEEIHKSKLDRTETDYVNGGENTTSLDSDDEIFNNSFFNMTDVSTESNIAVNNTLKDS